MAGLDEGDDGVEDDDVAREDSRSKGNGREDEDKRFRERMWEEMDMDDSFMHDFEEEGERLHHATHRCVKAIPFACLPPFVLRLYTFACLPSFVGVALSVIKWLSLGRVKTPTATVNVF